jgi:glycosyltransferase involved in cell wall biosynthesis
VNILVICREIPPVGGGAGHVAIHLAEESARAGHRVQIVTMHYGELPRLEDRGAIRIHRIACGRKNQDSSYLLEMARFAVGSGRAIDRIAGECDLIHAHAIVPDGWMGAGAARRRGIPLVLTAHGSDVPGYNTERFGLAHRLLRPLWRRTLDRAAAVVTPSQHLAGMIRAARPGQTVTVIPNGIRPDAFRPAEKDGSFLIVSRLVRRKNYHLFLEALSLVETPQTVHVAGVGPALDELKRIAAGLAPHRVVFHGWLENGSEAWRGLYERCSYFVLPSGSENFPVNLLEAQLAGMVVLASPIPGVREVVGEHAVFFDRLDAEGMARTVRAVLSGAAPGVDSLGACARERVRADFSWPAVAMRYLKLYGNIAGGKRHRDLTGETQ